MRHHKIIWSTLLLSILGCLNETTNNSASHNKQVSEPTIVLSTGDDEYNRVLAIRVSDLAETYSVGSEISIRVQITNQNPDEKSPPSQHPQAQLFPHLTLWVQQNGKTDSIQINLPIENRIRIKKGETFKRTVDLSSIQQLSKPGIYEISIGHNNFLVTDLGDWTGELRSIRQTIQIIESK